jgi:hypothetical protein
VKENTQIRVSKDDKQDLALAQGFNCRKLIQEIKAGMHVARKVCFCKKDPVTGEWGDLP